MSVTGSIRKVTLDGVTFNAMGDANLSQIKGAFTNESLPTSGKNVQKKTRRPQNVESVNLQCDSEEAELIKALSERTSNFPMSYQVANGDVFRAVGFINFENHDTENGTAAIVMMPESIDGFTLFGA